MTDANRPVNEQELDAYVDGQLDKAGREQVEAWLSQHPEEAKRVRQLQRLNALLKAEHQSIVTEPVPAGLDRIEVKPRAFSVPLPLFLAASVAWAVLGGLVGWAINDGVGEKYVLSASLAKPAMLAHVTYTPEVVHPVEVGADQEAHLIKWLSKRLGQNVSSPNLGAFGYALVGGRLLPATRDPAAQFMYENRDGVRVTLYVRTNADGEENTSFQYMFADGVGAFYWIDGNLGYALSGAVTRDELLKLATAVYQKLEL